jgi:hypothetical protein
MLEEQKLLLEEQILLLGLLEQSQRICREQRARVHCRTNAPKAPEPGRRGSHRMKQLGLEQ